MRLRYGLPLTLAVLILTTGASWWLDLPLYYPIAGLTTVWVVLDARRVGIRQYPTSLALPTIPLFIVLIIAWPIAFPWYLRIRWRIRHGTLAPGASSTPRWALVALLLLSSALVTTAVFLPRLPVFGPLLGLAHDISSRCLVGVSVARQSGGDLIVYIPTEQAPSDSDARDGFARSVAAVAYQHSPPTDKPTRVVIGFRSVEQRGGVTVRRDSIRHRWAGRDLAGENYADLDASSELVRQLIDHAHSGASDEKTLLTDTLATEWQSVAAMITNQISTASPDSIVFLPCLSFSPPSGEWRKRAFYVFSGPRWSLLEIWIEDSDSRQAISTVQVRGPAPLQD